MSGQFEPVLHARFLEDMHQVHLDCSGGDGQSLRNLLVAQALHDVAQDLDLALDLGAARGGHDQALESFGAGLRLLGQGDRINSVEGAKLLGATAMRLLQYPAAFRPALYQVGSFMGVAVVLALVGAGLQEEAGIGIAGDNRGAAIAPLGPAVFGIEEKAALENELACVGRSGDPLHEALERAEEQRPAFVAAACGADGDLRRALDHASAPCREVLELRYFADLSYQELSRALRLNVKTVSSRLSKCLDRLEAVAARMFSREKKDSLSV